MIRANLRFCWSTVVVPALLFLTEYIAIVLLLALLHPVLANWSAQLSNLPAEITIFIGIPMPGLTDFGLELYCILVQLSNSAFLIMLSIRCSRVTYREWKDGILHFYLGQPYDAVDFYRTKFLLQLGMGFVLWFVYCMVVMLGLHILNQVAYPNAGLSLSLVWDMFGRGLPILFFWLGVANALSLRKRGPFPGIVACSILAALGLIIGSLYKIANYMIFSIQNSGAVISGDFALHKILKVHRFLSVFSYTNMLYIETSFMNCSWLWLYAVLGVIGFATSWILLVRRTVDYE